MHERCSPTLQTCKYKASQVQSGSFKAESTLLRASLSPSGQQLLCGSENGRVFVWETLLQSERAGVKDSRRDGGSHQVRYN